MVEGGRWTVEGVETKTGNCRPDRMDDVLLSRGQPMDYGLRRTTYVRTNGTHGLFIRSPSGSCVTSSESRLRRIVHGWTSHCTWYVLALMVFLFFFIVALWRITFCYVTSIREQKYVLLPSSPSNVTYDMNYKLLIHP